MSDTYKIGISVVLGNLMSAELLKIIGQLGIADKAALSFAAKVGVAAGAMTVLGMALKEGVDEARKFQVEVAKFSLFGMDDKTNQQAQKFAENMKIVGTSATDAMKLMVEAQGIFRESGKSGDEALKSAELFAPYMAKMDFVAKTLNGENAGKLHAENQAMLRFIDMMGANVSGEKAKEWVDFGFKLTESTGGNVDWEQLRQFRQYGKTAAAGLSPIGIVELEPMIQELRGAAGTGLSQAYNRANGLIKQIPIQSINEFIASGLWDKNVIIRTKGGGIKEFVNNQNPLLHADLMAARPVEYYEKYVLPYYELKKYTEAEKYRENALLFGAGTGGNLFNAIDRQLGVSHGSVDSYDRAKQLDDAVKAAHDTIDGKLVDLTANWASLMKDMGQSLLPAVNNGLSILNGTLKGVANVFEFLNKGHEASQANDKNHSWVSRASGWAMLSDYFRNDNTPNMLPGGDQRPIHITLQVDGRDMAHVVADQFGNEMNKNPNSGSFFDERASPSYGLVYR